MRLDFEPLQKEAKEIRIEVLKIIFKAHAAHIASSYSCIDLLVYLYEKVLRINPKKPTAPNRDRFILSKGWAVSALYAILNRKGFFKKELLKSYCQNGSKLIGCITNNGIPGIEATTGSAGHGLAIGAGMALGAKIKNEKHRVFVLTGDGECNEGSTWETMLIAAHHKLDNLVAIIDYNKWQAFGKTNEILNLEPFAKKWESFNWSVKIINGHNFNDMHNAFAKIPINKNKPTVIIGHTIKGKGVSIFENKNEWHYKTPTENELLAAKKELLI